MIFGIYTNLNESPSTTHWLCGPHSSRPLIQGSSSGKWKSISQLKWIIWIILILKYIYYNKKYINSSFGEIILIILNISNLPCKGAALAVKAYLIIFSGLSYWMKTFSPTYGRIIFIDKDTYDL